MSSALLAAIDCRNNVHLIIGSNPLAAARCTRALQAGARPKVVALADADVHYGLRKRIEDGEVEWIEGNFEQDHLTTCGRPEVDNFVDAVFVTTGRDKTAVSIYNLCRRLRIPINVSDSPDLCTFTLLSTYSDGPLHVGVTTSGNGCKLAARIRREIASSLPPALGAACARLGSLRRGIWEEDTSSGVGPYPEIEEDTAGQSSDFNHLIRPEDRDAARGRRMRWLSQICEYWPLERLAAITDEDIETMLQEYSKSHKEEKKEGQNLAVDPIDEHRRRHARIVLAGSGPGHPELLTIATLKAILSADLVLADKLVPAGVLALIPRRTVVFIARKFPGNADKAQEELLHMGLEGLQAGKLVLRLKQGDPYIYGRGAEEFSFFAKYGYQVKVLPGITSALSAPLFAAIPPTHRAVADQVLICTGTGRKGALPEPPRYIPNQTVVFLMALHRLPSLVTSLISEDTEKPAQIVWPRDCPCAVVERASCPDQRIIRTTLEHVEAAVEEEGSRPPGLLILGWCCAVLWDGKKRWAVEEGFHGLDSIGLEGVPILDFGKTGTPVLAQPELDSSSRNPESSNQIT